VGIRAGTSLVKQQFRTKEADLTYIYWKALNIWDVELKSCL
jgi:hypothetical protein